jgi:Flp pilus assembly protein TadG
MVEFLIVIPLLLLILLGTLQFALIYQAKITLNYAAFEAARAGSLNSAREFAMYDAVARTMAPLYTHEATIDAYKAGRQQVRDEIDNGYVLIEVVNPSPDSFSDFGNTDNGRTYIPSDNLIYRGAGVGTDSNQTIQDANLLKIQVYYCYELVVPFVNRILWVMMRYSPLDPTPADLPQVDAQHRFGRPEAGTFTEQCVRTKNEDDDYFGIPIRAQGIMRMQSDAELPGSA